MPSKYSANGSREDDAILLLREIQATLLKLTRRVDQLSAQVNALQHSVTGHVVVAAEDAETPLSDEKLLQMLEAAQASADPYAVLDLRRVLIERLDSEEQGKLDRDLARWFTEHFHKALRSGHAAVVAGALERAVEEFGPLPEMQLLADALPMILRSVGLYEESRQEPSADLED